MRFQRQAKIIAGLEQINMAPLIDVIFLLLLFFMLSTSFTIQSGIRVKLPTALTSDALQEENFVITITSENVIYLNDKILNIRELKKELSDPTVRKRPVLIKADRRASVGRIVDVWDLCRQLNIEHVQIATDQKK